MPRGRTMQQVIQAAHEDSFDHPFIQQAALLSGNVIRRYLRIEKFPSRLYPRGAVWHKLFVEDAEVFPHQFTSTDKWGFIRLLHLQENVELEDVSRIIETPVAEINRILSGASTDWVMKHAS